MAVHTALGIAMGWPFPSATTFLAGILAVPWALARAPPPARSIGGAAAMAFLVPSIVPPATLVVGVAALIGTYLAAGEDPFQNLAVALPALTFLTLCLTG